MSELSNAEVESAKNGAAQGGHEICASENIGTTVPEFALVAQSVWKVKTPAALHDHTHASERTCRAWASGDREPLAGVLITLLRSREGLLVLRAIMRTDPPQWWLNLMFLKECAEAYEAQRKRG